MSAEEVPGPSRPVRLPKQPCLLCGIYWCRRHSQRFTGFIARCTVDAVGALIRCGRVSSAVRSVVRCGIIPVLVLARSDYLRSANNKRASVARERSIDSPRKQQQIERPRRNHETQLLNGTPCSIKSTFTRMDELFTRMTCSYKGRVNHLTRLRLLSTSEP